MRGEQGGPARLSDGREADERDAPVAVLGHLEAGGRIAPALFWLEELREGTQGGSR